MLTIVLVSDMHHLAGLAYSLGSGAMSNSIPEIENADVLFIFGYNGADSHPIVANRIVKAKKMVLN